MIKKYSFFTTLFVLFIYLLSTKDRIEAASLWQVQSIDTMKTSRDQTLYKQNVPSYDKEIQKELTAIKSMGANYVAIDGAYDKLYIPWMKRWVNEARILGLHVWFRGNFSGWHGWFGPKNMTREEHIKALRSFILNNSDLFQDGDSFTACPECEYGGPGNPLETKDIDGFRKFILDEYQVMDASFRDIHKKVNINWLNMNPDVAKEVLDDEIVNKLDNVITLDYYVKDTQDLDNGLHYFITKFPNAKILIGEFGAPLPAINGTMTDTQQADFINQILNQLYKYNDKILGINYWVSYYDFTSLLYPDYSPKPAVTIMENYFQSTEIKGTITNSLGDREGGVLIMNEDGSATNSDRFGNYMLFIPQNRMVKLLIDGDVYSATPSMPTVRTSGEKITQNFVVTPKHPSLLYRVRLFWKQLWK